jgi:hypothetical protein
MKLELVLMQSLTWMFTPLAAATKVVTNIRDAITVYHTITAHDDTIKQMNTSLHPAGIHHAAAAQWASNAQRMPGTSKDPAHSLQTHFLVSGLMAMHEDPHHLSSC